MTTKTLALSLAAALSVTAATAQTTIKSGGVPKEVFTQYAAQTSKTAAKKAAWTMTPTSYTAEYDGTFTRLDYSGNVVWTSKRIDDSDIDSEIWQSYQNKYASDYTFRYAEDVTLANGEKRTFLIGTKGAYDYYFKYNDKKLMVEKTATCK
jgi:hypothetical protein